MNILLFAGSLRTGSLNKKLVMVASDIAAHFSNIQTTVVDLKTLSLPVYDGDIETAGMPEGVTALGAKIKATDAIIISSPEYNGSISSPLKNTIDWVSRLRPVPFDKKPILLLAASPGGFGGVQALRHERAPLETLGAYVYPQPFALPKAHEAFGPNGDLLDGATKEKLSGLIKNYLQFAERLTATSSTNLKS